MKNVKLKKIDFKTKGFTLIEVLLLVSMVLGFILIFFNIDMNTDKEQNARKIGTQLNMFATAIDKRISVEGKKFSYWKNGDEWNGSSKFQEFLRQELVGKNNSTCGDTTKGWSPTLNLNGLDPLSEEGKNVVYLHNNALTSKLIPCTLWQVTPYNIQANVKIFEDSDNNLKNVLFTFNFSNLNDWNKGFADFNKSYNFAKEQKNTTLLTKKEFYYSNASGSKINFRNCLNIKENCSLNMNVLVGSSSTDDKKFKVDSSNSFETNLGFAKSVKYNEQINCNIWTLNTSTIPVSWESRVTACGVTGGTDGDKEIALIGDNIDAQNIKITGRCRDYSTTFASAAPYSECGLINDNSYVEINNNNIQSNNAITEEMKVQSSKIHEVNIKEKLTSVKTDVWGNSKSEQLNGSTFTSPYKDCVAGVISAGCPSNWQILQKTDGRSMNALYRITPSGIAFENKDLNVKELKVDYDTLLNKIIRANLFSISNKFEGKKAITTDNLTVNGESYLTSSNFTNSSISGKLTAKDKTNINIAQADNKAIISGNITANDLLATGSVETEQLNFRTAFNSDELVKFSKSLSFDNLGNKYIIKNNAISGWGAEGYLSNSGIYASKFKVNGNIIVNSKQLPSNAYIYENNWGYLQNYTGFRNGLTLTHQFPDTRGMFYMNDVGKVFVSGYYDVGAANTGLQIGNKTGKGLFWGRNPRNMPEMGDKPIKTNLDSSIYGYKAGQDITDISGGYKMIMNSLSVVNAFTANLYSGAYYHAGLPRKMDIYGNISADETPINYIQNGVGVYWETADGIYLRSLNTNIKYYLDRIAYIYGNYVNLNKIGTIKGAKGDRGARGDTGIQGLRGENGTDGIPGPVGIRGGE